MSLSCMLEEIVSVKVSLSRAKSLRPLPPSSQKRTAISKPLSSLELLHDTHPILPLCSFHQSSLLRALLLARYTVFTLLPVPDA